MHAEEEISLIDLLIVVARSRRQILFITLTMIAIGLAVSLLWPNEYTASTAILPPQQAGSGGSALMAQLGSLAGC
jgi:LPS O-antigen subunit length determinant protein (WzzB/FepE family)